jgi:hypothetical protein
LAVLITGLLPDSPGICIHQQCPQAILKTSPARRTRKGTLLKQDAFVVLHGDAREEL